MADATDPAVLLPQVDVLVGNVALQPLVALGRRVCETGHDRALPRDVILAGLLATQLEEAVAAWRGYVIAGRLDDGEWSAAHLRLEGRPTPVRGRS